MKTKNQTIIFIEGYYIDDGKFESNFGGQYTCCIGTWDGKEDAFDEEIFYYFENLKEVKLFMEKEHRTDTEFVITKVMDENYKDITKEI